MKDIIVFSKDQMLLDSLLKFTEGVNITNYPYDHSLETINFADKLLLVDIDSEDLNLKGFLTDLSSFAKGRIIVLSVNCERKNIVNCAKYGADRFVVKPLNKKRFKAVILKEHSLTV